MVKTDVVMVGIVGTVEMEMVADVKKKGAPRLPRVAEPNLRSREHQILISENRRMCGCIKAVRLNEGVSQLRARARGGEKRMHMHMRNVRSKRRRGVWAETWKTPTLRWSVAEC